MVRRGSLLCIVAAEDDDHDWVIMEEAFSSWKGDVKRVKDGQELMDRLLDPEQPLPDLILLDLNMPRMSGYECLKAIRGGDRTRHIPVIVLTTSKNESDIRSSYQSGANTYVCKPLSFEGMEAAIQAIEHYWGYVAELVP